MVSELDSEFARRVDYLDDVRDVEWLVDEYYEVVFFEDTPPSTVISVIRLADDYGFEVQADRIGDTRHIARQRLPVAKPIGK